jgi:radical SAM protein with 4Fe4S-binding SPASM domain
MSEKEVFNLLQQIKNIGVSRIVFAGGEPFFREDFFEILRKCKELGFFVGVISNGTLINEDTAKRLREIGIDRVQVSLDGPQKINDVLRGKGTFEKAVNGIKNLLRQKVKTGVRITLTRLNYPYVLELIKFLESIGVKNVAIRMVMPVGRAKNKWKQLALPLRKYVQIMEKLFRECTISVESGDPLLVIHNEKLLKKIKKAGNVKKGEVLAGCLAGVATLFINAQGTVFPCASLPLPLGSVKEKPLKEILENSRVIKELQNYKELLKGKCGKCTFKWICGGCRAVTYAIRKDLFASDPRCRIC